MKVDPLTALLAVSFSAFARDHHRSDDRLVNLRGRWRFSIGDDARRAQPGFDDSDWSTVHVPSYWEEEGYEDYNGFAGYRRTFSFDGDPNQATHLLLGQVDDVDEVFLNGTKIGGTGNLDDSDRHSGGDSFAQLRGYYFPGSLLKDDNVLAVRVHNHGGRGGIYDVPLGIISQSRYIDYWENIRRDRHWHHHGKSLLRTLLVGDDD